MSEVVPGGDDVREEPDGADEGSNVRADVEELAPGSAAGSSDVSVDVVELAPGSADGSFDEIANVSEVASGSAASVVTGAVRGEISREASVMDADAYDSVIGGGTDTSMKTSSEYLRCF